MKSFIKTLLFFVLFNVPSVNASESTGIYISLAPALIKIDTSNASTRPTLVDVRLGYEFDAHLFELVVMSSINDDSLNQLTVDVPSVNSIFYHYLPYRDNSLKIHLIIGASQIEVDSSYPNIADTTDTFEGASIGLGLEEAFTSIPELKLKMDIMRLYKGDDLNINFLSIGVRYVF
ncbi:MAG: hypothetical protein DIZ80_12645 [endosymbiont of Galathealinum brachiosum]|uniref:Outer membrane protein beta-barrel domain-containing protein n=1 Tax=endosymbiont of Galathealinum brachiosum TaxID=2200906 RepID=A0A370DDX4_9GAMM|nr:MAG: hypothetical protein DIZ80_12645 [endosymbiont of Galathealinum brachiosum]